MNLYRLRELITPIIDGICRKVWFLRPLYETRGTGNQITVGTWFSQKVMGHNRFAPWPVHRSSRVFGLRWIRIGVNTAPGLSPGCYIFAKADCPIEIGDYTLMAPNVGVAGFNHDPLNIYEYDSKGGVTIGRYCWLGMNAVVLPGVRLGDHTIVAAGAVVTKSFPEGYCILGGNPARKLRELPRDQVVEYRHPYEYVGYRRVNRKD